MSPEALKLYATRDHMALGEHYMRHVSAMTGEGLHAKSAIAAELAHRDAEIERLTAERDAAQAERSDLSLLVGRLIVRMRAARKGQGIEAGDEALAQQAIGYLRRKGLVSPLRDEERAAISAAEGKSDV